MINTYIHTFINSQTKQVAVHCKLHPFHMLAYVTSMWKRNENKRTEIETFSRSSKLKFAA